MPLLIKILPELCVILMLVGAFTVGHIKGNASCEIAKAKNDRTSLVKGEKDHEQIKKKVMSLDDGALNRELSGWLQ